MGMLPPVEMRINLFYLNKMRANRWLLTLC